ncbi:MAG: UvrY/SirA/GacA family response regulator transcription factor [Gammaproteobacteria bacterium]|nr:MAG: UvrY/SirA/GacA family response regulator transcription factor [Gammaproteobacteria bacterium]
MIQLLIIDDQTLVRIASHRALQDQYSISSIDSVATDFDAQYLLKQHIPDVILLDCVQSGIAKLNSVKRLLRYDHSLKIIIFTECINSLFPKRLLECGAYGYLHKKASIEECVTALSTVNAGKQYISSVIADKMVNPSRLKAEECKMNDLSNRELEIMSLVAKGLRGTTISQQLCLSPKTISYYRNQIFGKLCLRNNIDITRVAVRYGI